MRREQSAAETETLAHAVRADDRFFAALLAADVDALSTLLEDRFQIINVGNGDVAVIVGRTRMRALVSGQEFKVGSRYTHVLLRTGEDSWQLVNAQGTQLPEEEPR
jgi:hypothetical protein